MCCSVASLILQIVPKGFLTTGLGTTLFININNSVWLFVAISVLCALHMLPCHCHDAAAVTDVCVIVCRCSGFVPDWRDSTIAAHSRSCRSACAIAVASPSAVRDLGATKHIKGSVTSCAAGWLEGVRAQPRSTCPVGICHVRHTLTVAVSHMNIRYQACMQQTPPRQQTLSSSCPYSTSLLQAWHSYKQSLDGSMVTQQRSRQLIA